jgi:hypothetical protein
MNLIHFFNYWQYSSSTYDLFCLNFYRQGFSEIGCFIPWEHFEKDTEKKLQKFIKSAIKNHLKINLVITPCLGVDYRNCGIPEEYLHEENLAYSQKGEKIYNLISPNIFCLPSFYSSSVLRGFGSYLIKLCDSIVALEKEIKNLSDFLSLTITSAFYNYYRSMAESPYTHGDYSLASQNVFKEFKEKILNFSSDEVLECERESILNNLQGENSSQEIVTKEVCSKSYFENDFILRHKFHSFSENKFFEKVETILSKKNVQLKINKVSLSCIEALPENSYFTMLSQAFDLQFDNNDSYGFKEIISSSLLPCLVRGEVPYYTKWIDRLSQKQKEFLILNSYLYTGMCFLEFNELREYSDEFIEKKQFLEQIFRAGFIKESKIAYMTASQFSFEKNTFTLLHVLSQASIKIVTDIIEGRNKDENLLFVDPKLSITLLDFAKAVKSAESGKTVAIPAPIEDSYNNYTQEAYQEYKKLRYSFSSQIQISKPIAYSLFNIGSGVLIIYDPKVFLENKKENINYDAYQFIEALVRIAEVEPKVKINQEGVELVCLKNKNNLNQKIYFLVNSNETAQTINLGAQSINLPSLSLTHIDFNSLVLNRQNQKNISGDGDVYGITK